MKEMNLKDLGVMEYLKGKIKNEKECIKLHKRDLDTMTRENINIFEFGTVLENIAITESLIRERENRIKEYEFDMSLYENRPF